MLHWFLSFLARLPLSIVHMLGAWLGWGVYLISPRYRHRFKQNFAQAFPNDKTLLRTAISEAGKSFLELPAIWFRPTGEIIKLVTQISGIEHVETIWRQGKGIIFLTPHLGCFEITPICYSERAPITILYRPPRLLSLRPVLNEARGRENITLAPTDISGVRKLFTALKQKEAIGILPDQVPSFGEGVWAPFFGRPAYTMTLVGRLQQTTNAEIILAYAQRLPKGQGYHIHLSPIPRLTGNAQEQTTQLNQALEQLIRQYPSQYLWGYNRYKVPRGVAKPVSSSESQVSSSQFKNSTSKSEISPSQLETRNSKPET